MFRYDKNSVYDLYGICNHMGGTRGDTILHMLKTQIINGIYIMIRL